MSKSKTNNNGKTLKKRDIMSFIPKINSEIVQHDKNTNYNISNDMLLPYLENYKKKLNKNEYDIIVELLKNNRFLLYLDQYFNIQQTIEKQTPNKENIKLVSEKDLIPSFFKLPVLDLIIGNIEKSDINLTIPKVIQLYNEILEERVNNAQTQIKLGYDNIQNMEPRLLLMHGGESNKMFIVPNDIIICKVASYNYISMSDPFWVFNFKKILQHYKNNNILNSSCCAKNGQIFIYFPGQICNDTNLSIDKNQFIVKRFMGIYSINEKNKLLKHQINNFEIDNKYYQLISLSRLAANNELKHKILIIHSCRGQHLGSIASYTEFNYRLEKIQLLLSQKYCDCTDILKTKYNLPTSFLGLNKFYKKAFKFVPVIFDNNQNYIPFYDTYLSTNINKFRYLKQNNTKTTHLSLKNIDKNNEILNAMNSDFDNYLKKRFLFIQLYNSRSNDEIIDDSLIIIMVNILINLAQYKHQYVSIKIINDDEVLKKTLFYSTLLEQIYINNTLNITKPTKLLKNILDILCIFIIKVYKFNRLSEQQKTKNVSIRQTLKTTSKHTGKLSSKQNAKSSAKHSAKLGKYTPKQVKRLNNFDVREYLLKLLDVFFKLSQRFGKKINTTIVELLKNKDLKEVIDDVVVKNTTPGEIEQISKVIKYLSNLCNNCIYVN